MVVRPSETHPDGLWPTGIELWQQVTVEPSSNGSKKDVSGSVRQRHDQYAPSRHPTSCSSIPSVPRIHTAFICVAGCSRHGRCPVAKYFSDPTTAPALALHSALPRGGLQDTEQQHSIGPASRPKEGSGHRLPQGHQRERAPSLLPRGTI